MGEEQARRDRFEELVRELVDPLRAYLARRTDPATADDVLGDTLLVLWRRVEELPEQPLPWAYAVARRCLANAERGRRRRARLAARVAAADPPAHAVPGSDEAGDRPTAAGTDPELAAALAALRPADAELLRLWAWEQLTPSEIAAVLGITPNAASIRLHRARERLRARMRRGSLGKDRTGKDQPDAGQKESRGGSAR